MNRRKFLKSVGSVPLFIGLKKVVPDNWVSDTCLPDPIEHKEYTASVQSDRTAHGGALESAEFVKLLDKRLRSIAKSQYNIAPKEMGKLFNVK